MAGTIALGTLVFDVGSLAAPATGAVITATSGATGVVHVVTVSTGVWGDNNVTGTITLGSCTGLFNDDEAVTWTGGSCTVNHPDGSVGADGHVKNGAFVTDNDPPNDWGAENGAVLTTEAGGKVTNCMMITCNGFNNPQAAQTMSVTAGKIYKLNGYVKAGTEATYEFKIYDVSNSTFIYASGSLEETAGDWSTEMSKIFEAPAGCSSVRIQLKQIATTGAGTTIYFDEVSFYLLGSGGGGNHYMFMDMKL